MGSKRSKDIHKAFLKVGLMGVPKKGPNADSSEKNAHMMILCRAIAILLKWQKKGKVTCRC